MVVGGRSLLMNPQSEGGGRDAGEDAEKNSDDGKI